MARAWVWRRLASTGLILAAMGCQARVFQPMPAQASALTAVSAKPVTFDSDETLFTWMAWLNWVGEMPASEEKRPSFPVRQALQGKLKALPAALRAKHQAAFDRFLTGYPRTGKASMVLMIRRMYEPAPSFVQRPLDPTIGGVDGAFLKEVSQLNPPSPELLREFYKAADIRTLWQTLVRPETERVAAGFEAQVQPMIRETAQLLRMGPKAPVVMQVNLLGTYGIKGQTLFSPWDKRFTIQVNPYATTGASYASGDRKVFRHEYTHAVMNDSVAANKGLIEPALARVGKALGIELTEVEELFAQCMGDYDSPPDEVDFLFHTGENVLLRHFVAKLPEYKASGQTMAAYLPTLFRSFDADQAIADWKRIEAADASRPGT